MTKPSRIRPGTGLRTAPDPSIRVGDRVAFITLGPNPRTLCAVVTEALIRDRGGRPMHRVQAAGRLYFARPNALYKLPQR